MSSTFDRATALSIVTSTLADAVACAYMDALPIDGYAGTGVLADWVPAPGRCHEQVECWLAMHPADTPVRGWLADGGNDAQQRFVSHSLVRTAAGELLDVAYPQPPYVQHFVEHPAAAGDFFALVRGELWVSELYVFIPSRS
ncbi:hypothetical protein OIV57_23015 [Burkholderia pseudomallei]|uniref:hypothetical protein n=1 Tax=Burkholderia pseudomallei TaxID=28450 RepID=UPI0010439AF7|nr:hypothetical protein [Burkholderia pseudomallei]MCV9915007.1 hypothetical protein [Burkholderia pseudomallei]MCW0071045.1 hypothetical protein [Burkholderia pseudomallei]